MSGSVTAIHLHPVKACGRIEVDEAVVGPFGFKGDREWQVILADGRYLTQRTHPILATVRPVPLTDGGLRLAAERPGAPAPLEVPAPSGAARQAEVLLGTVDVLDAGDDAAAWFEMLLGRPARLVRMAPGYRRRLAGGAMDIWDQDVNLNDAAPMHVVNQASHEFLARDGVEPFGIERFRPNLIIDGFDAWDEDRWQAVQVGDAILRAPFPWPRCAVPQVDQDTGERHKEPAVVLKRWRWCNEADAVDVALRPFLVGNAIFGVGFAAGPAGSVIRVGDPVEVVKTRQPLLRLPTG